MQRNVNKGHEYNPPDRHAAPVGPRAGRTLTDLLCEELGVEEGDILDRDLQLVTRQAPTQIGPDGEYFMAPRIDDLGMRRHHPAGLHRRFRRDGQRLRPRLGDAR